MSGVGGGDGAAQRRPAELEHDRPEVSDLLLEIASAPERDPSTLVPLAPGARVGRFELVREVGRGGFGVVFEARDTELGRRVAFKAMKPSRLAGPALEKPLREEAEAAARLNHPNVVTLHDYGLHHGTPYLILELLEGETLHQRLKRGPLAPEAALAVGRAVARGLVHAHAQGVLHRDLKPGNVFLAGDGGVKLLDFGLARLLDRASLAGGTPAYMAPEQLRGEAGDARADVFGAGVMLFQMLTGRVPYPVKDGRSAALDSGPPPALPLDHAPPELVTLVAGTLSRDPAGRPQTAGDLLAGLESVERAFAGRAVERLRAARRRRLRGLVVGASVLALLAAAAATMAAARARRAADRSLRAARIISAAEGASDPLIAVLLLAELGEDAPPRAVEVAQRILREPVPVAVLEPARGGLGLALSPDGTRVAAGALDGGATVWPADGTGAPRVVPGGGLRANDIAFTPDGARLVVAGQDGVVRILPADGRGEPRAVDAGGVPLVRVAVAPDGRRAAAGAVDGRAWLLPLDGARPAWPLLHDGAVFDLAFSPDGARLATACADGWLRIWDARAGALLLRAPVPGGAAFALAWDTAGERIVLAMEDGVARIADARGRVVATLGTPGEPLDDVAFSPDGTRIAVAGGEGLARVFVPAKDTEFRLRGHRGSVLSIAFTADGKGVLTTGADGTARRFAVDGDDPPIVFHTAVAGAALLSRDGARLFTRGKDSVRVWRTDDPSRRGILAGHRDLVDTVEWTRDGARLVTASHDGSARIWPVHGGAPLEVEDPGHVLHAAHLDREERLLVTASQDGNVRLWDAASGAAVRTLGAHDGPALSAAFSPDGRRVASGGIDRTVRVWPVAGDGPASVFTGHDGVVTAVTWTPDGRSVISSSEFDGTVRIWPVDGGPPRAVHVEAGVFRAIPTADGRRLLVAEDGGALRTFRLDTLEELAPFPALPEGLFTAAPSPDGERLALASSDGTVRVYRSSGPADPLVLRGHEGAVGDAVFSPDGEELATASADGTARVWTVSWDRTLAELRGATSACLPVRHRTQVLGEGPAEAEARVATCHAAHGRSPAPAQGGGP